MFTCWDEEMLRWDDCDQAETNNSWNDNSWTEHRFI